MTPIVFSTALFAIPLEPGWREECAVCEAGVQTIVEEISEYVGEMSVGLETTEVLLDIEGEGLAAGFARKGTVVPWYRALLPTVGVELILTRPGYLGAMEWFLFLAWSLPP